MKDLQTKIKNSCCYPIAAFVTIICCILLLFLSAMVPRKLVKEQCYESAEYFMNTPIFDKLLGDQIGSKRDNYGDCILMNIAYHLDEKHPIRSAITASYYSKEYQNENVNFYESFEQGDITTVDYFRYWHGSLIFLRPLSVWFSISQIRTIIAIAVALLHAGVIFMLCRIRQIDLAVFYGVSAFLVDFYFAGICIEYSMVFLIEPVAAMLAIAFAKEKKSIEQKMKKMTCLFLCVGVVTCFFDFLTTETLTFTIPFFLWYSLIHRNGESKAVKKEWMFLVKSGMMWFIGYAGMYLIKWMLAAFVLGKDAFLAAFEAARVRVNEGVTLSAYLEGERASTAEWISGIIYRNFGALFHANGSTSSALIFIIAFLIFCLLGIFWYLFRKSDMEYRRWGIVLVLAILPYIRYFVLANHSFYHYFFTYRAQMITVLAILCFIYETTHLSDWIKGKKRKKAKERSF